MQPSLRSFSLELTKLAAPQGFLRAIRERGLGKVVKEYLDHSALNAGQATRDVRYFLNHPHADAIAAAGTLRHRMASIRPRAKSLLNNLYYTAIPPHMHHEAEQLIGSASTRLKANFLYGYKPWDHPDPSKMR